MLVVHANIGHGRLSLGISLYPGARKLSDAMGEPLIYAWVVALFGPWIGFWPFKE